MSTATFSPQEFMNPTLEIKYLSLEKSRNRLLDELEGFDEELLTAQPAEGKWSINQIILHLIQVEKFTTGYVQNKLQKNTPLKSSAFSNKLKFILLKLALKSTKKFVAPAPVANVPNTETLLNLRKQWDNTRFSLEDLLNDLPAHSLNKYYFKHPSVGPLTIPQTLGFLQDHFNHHLRQIELQRKNLIK
jgi:uncharacterized damage-inducible protein DinB